MKNLTAADALVLSGLVGIAGALWWMYPPLSALWAGTLAVYFGVTFHRQRKEGGK
jgi:heme/copper-type cytochrome/quinol oxidase subunit 1